MPAGDDQAFDLLRQHRTIGRVVVAPARHCVGKPDALHHVVLGDHILAFEQPRLADAELRRDIDHEAILEARHVRTHEIDQCVDALAPLEIGAREVLDLEPVIAGHVRAIAPHDAGQRGLEPPMVPRAAHGALGLPVELGELLWLRGGESLGLLGIDIPEPEHGRDDVRPFDEFRAGGCRDIEITGRIDHNVRNDRFAPRLGLADDPADAAVLHDCFRKPRVQPHVHAGLGDHLVRDALPAIRIEGGCEHDRLRLHLRAEIMAAPARPLAVFLERLSTLLRRRIDRRADLGHALDHLHAQTGDGDLLAVVHVVEHQHHAARRKPAEIGIALDQRNRAALAFRRDRRREPGRPATNHQHIRARHHARGAGHFFDAISHCGLPNVRPAPASAPPSARRTRSRGRTRPRTPSRRSRSHKAWPSRNCTSPG